jgi:hypothetical protein
VAEVHLVVGVAVVALNALAGIWGAVAWGLRRPSIQFWYVLRAAQVSVVAQVLLGALLLVAGEEANETMHYVYGALPLLVNMGAEGMRVGAAQREVGDVDFQALPAGEQRSIAMAIVRRETGIMAVAALIVAALAVRAGQVSGELF